MKKAGIYLDYAATTPVDPRVLDAMLPYFREHYGNPSSIHHIGRQARQAVDDARRTIARFLQCRPAEIYFTSGGTEANNLAIQGIARANRNKGHHIITTAIEHPSVLETVRLLESEGFDVTYLYPDSDGLISPEQLEKAIRRETILVSVMMVNNEIGVRQPLAELIRVAKANGILFHTDAVQGFGKFPLDLQNLPVDALSFSAHKIYGPKGIGGLFLRKGVAIKPLMGGGGQENGLRSGTLNVPGIVGLAKATMLMETEGKRDFEHVASLARYFLDELQQRIPDAVVNGSPEYRSPYILNISFPNCDNQALQMHLDMEGIAVSTGSACHSGTVEASHVLKALRLPDDRIQSALRFSLGRFTQKADIDHTLDVLQKAVNQLR